MHIASLQQTTTNPPHTDRSDDEGAEVDDGREIKEEESTDDSDYDFDDDSDGIEEDF